MTGDETGPDGAGPGSTAADGRDGANRDGRDDAESVEPRGATDDRPTPEPSGGESEGPNPRDGPRATLRWFLTTDEGIVAFTREFARSALAVLLVGLLLFGVSGVWPPMVAVESPSMEPHMQPGDLVFLMDEHRLVPGTAEAGTGVATYQAVRESDSSYRRFGDYGDVIVYTTPERSAIGRPPIIHRARLWVEEGENWYDRANPDHVRASECGDTVREGLRYCPAPHDGFITMGDANPYYDQSQGLSPPVRPSWIRGTAEVRVPWLGCVRLYFEGFDAVPNNCRL
jgi:signal peptidase